MQSACLRAVALCVLMLFGAMAVLFAAPVQAQGREGGFAVEAVSVRGAADHLTRVDLYARVPFARLRFLSTAEGFAARYTMTVEAYRLSRDGERLFLAERRLWERTVTADAFGATRSTQHFDRWVESLELRPGPYAFAFRLEDPAAERALTQTLTVDVRDLSAPVAVSDLVLLDGFDAAASTITPRIGTQVNAGAGALTLFYELYAEAPRTVHVTHEIARAPQSSGTGIPVLGTLLSFGREDEPPDRGEVTYAKVEPRTVQVGRTPSVVTLPLLDAEVGEYVVRVQVETRAGEVLDVAEKRITLRWQGLVAHLRDLREAVDQLRYIAKDEDLTFIREGSTRAERLERFRAFWDKRDPTPATRRNERMEEYYYRVAQANQDYSREARNLVAGWETDRGHVLVRFGQPDAIERHPRSADARPYEVWHYEATGRRFIFVDQGRGRYELLEPIWDERTRIR